MFFLEKNVCTLKIILKILIISICLRLLQYKLIFNKCFILMFFFRKQCMQKLIIIISKFNEFN